MLLLYLPKGNKQNSPKVCGVPKFSYGCMFPFSSVHFTSIYWQIWRHFACLRIKSPRHGHGDAAKFRGLFGLVPYQNIGSAKT